MSVKVILFTLVALSMAQQNYQERAIYLGWYDNHCYLSGDYEDDMKLTVIIPGQEPYEAKQISFTNCQSNVVDPSWAIYPSDQIIHYNGDKDIYI